MGNLLDMPKTEKLHGAQFVSSTGIHVGVSSMQGWRIEMEDAHVVCDFPSKPDHIFVAVYDGHGGAGASKYASLNIINMIESTPSWKAYQNNPEEDPELIGKALVAAYLDIDDRMRGELTDSSGCTAVCAVITPKYIICANAGDSRCVMGTDGKTVELSHDHKPSDEGERRRIEKAGGCVQWKRVDGDLAVSRAMGDFQYKGRADLQAVEQKVTVFPDIFVQTRAPEDDVLILACDGLWDVYQSAEAVDLVREIYQSGEDNVELIAEELIDMALNKGSRDNISAIVVKLPGASLGPAGLGGVQKRREEREAKEIEKKQQEDQIQ